MTLRLLHNPRCSKSRQALALLEERGLEPEVVEYLKTPPSAADLDAIFKAMGKDPREVMRTREAPYKELDLKDPSLSRDALLTAMAANPILIERPILVNGKKAALGRPPEAILEIL
jgi:arsenate reductase